ncbi:MAG: beta-eliminating lyase-related protein [Pseudomonadota bacterium]
MLFTSDNASGAAPEILAALAQANDAGAMPYGNDPLTARVEERVREIFEAPEAKVYLVSTGTAANALALACLCPPWAQIYCQTKAHVEWDECNAPEFYTGGAKLTLIAGEGARIDAQGLRDAIAASAPVGVHNAQKGCVSITQATELGAVYTVEQLAEIGAIAREAGIPVHMDGTRFANAVVRLNASPAEMTWKAGIDILCLGATKNGAMAAEAVILFDPAMAWEFELRRKRGGHLFSKMRFVAAQMDAYLTDGLWLRLAGHANAMADRLAAGVEAAGATVHQARGANMVFARFSATQHQRLQAAGALYYPWAQGDDAAHPGHVSVRLVCSHTTEVEEVDRFCALLAA